MKSGNRAALDMCSHLCILSRTGSNDTFAPFDNFFDPFLDQVGASRRITTFNSAFEKDVIIVAETMLTNEKMTIIFQRIAPPRSS